MRCRCGAAPTAAARIALLVWRYAPQAMGWVRCTPRPTFFEQPGPDGQAGERIRRRRVDGQRVGQVVRRDALPRVECRLSPNRRIASVVTRRAWL